MRSREKTDKANPREEQKKIPPAPALMVKAVREQLNCRKIPERNQTTQPLLGLS